MSNNKITRNVFLNISWTVCFCKKTKNPEYFFYFRITNYFRNKNKRTMIIGSEYCEYVFILLQFIFLLIALIHFFWALGGKWGLEKTLPIKENGERLFTPKRIHSFTIGLSFVGMMGLVWLQFMVRGGTAKTELNPKYILYFLIAVFFLRALGDFKYIGFFKKIRNTSFAKSDTWFFSPLCLLISLLILMFLHGECGFIPFPFTFG